MIRSQTNCPKVYIIILNYKNHKDTLECLDSVKQLDYPNFTALAIDNDSSDESEEKIKEWIAQNQDDRFKFLQTGFNSGYAGGNNVGIKYALKAGDMDYAWLLNNDTTVKPDALTKIIQKFKSNSAIGLCGSRLVSYWDHSSIQSYGLTYNKFTASVKSLTNEQDIHKLDYVCGASMCLSKSFIDEIGMLSEDYFLYFEELDLVERSKGKFITDCAPDSIVYHKEGQSINGNSDKPRRSSLADFYSIRNRIVFTKKYHPFCLLSVYLWVFLILINKLRKGEYNTALMIIKILFKPYNEFHKV